MRGIDNMLSPVPKARADDIFTAYLYADNDGKDLSAECRSIPES